MTVLGLFNSQYTRETELRQGDQVQILGNTDVLCQGGRFTATARFSIGQDFRRSLSSLLQAFSGFI